MAKTVVGMFDSFESASAALDELVANGIPEQDLGVIRPGDKSGRAPGKVAGTKDRGAKAGSGAAAGAGTGAIVGGAAGLIAGLAGVAIPGLGPMVAAGWLASTLAGAGIGAVAGGLIGALIGAGVPEHEARIYEEGLRRGKTLVMVRCEDARAQQVAHVLERHGALDIDQSAKEFERMGWKREPARAETMRGRPEEEIRVPVVEEELQVGKRKIDTGVVRIYTRLSERTAEESIPLREERVRVERRPVGQAGTPEMLEDEDTVIEIHETAEEPVVSKRARVLEEYVISKEAREHEEVVRDTVRRRDVEVEPLAAGRAAGEDEFRRHYEQNLAPSGMSYDECAPAYRLGSELGRDEVSRGRQWDEVESAGRQAWEREHPGTWNRVRDAARYSWERVSRSGDEHRTERGGGGGQRERRER